MSGNCHRAVLGAALLVSWALALALAPSGAQAATWTAYSANYGAGTVTPINTLTNVAGASIAVNDPADIAITPDGTTAWVTNYAEATATPINLATKIAGTPVPVGGKPYATAITPDGSKAYVANYLDNDVTPIDLSTNTPSTPIPVGLEPDAIAITPDGAKAYIANHGSDSVTPITLATGTAGTPIPVGDGPDAIAITPDGAKVYVGNFLGDTVTPISTSTDTAGSNIAVSDPAAIAISPNGATAYVTNYLAGTITPITVASETLGTPITGAGTQPYAMAISPDGAKGYVADYATLGAVVPIDLATNTAAAGITVGNEADGVAITPDQAPVATFTVTPGESGSPSSFDASASTVKYGTIAQYRWNFGDGATATTSTPTSTHTYVAASVYTATLTETSSGGTSIAKVFTGKTLSRNGGPGARTTRSVVVGDPPAGGTPPSGDPPDSGDPSGGSGTDAARSKPVSISKKQVTLTRRGIAAVRVHCRKGGGRCIGTLTLAISLPRTRASASRRSRRVIARKRFSIPAGKTRSVKAHVSRHGRRRVLRKRRVHCRATMVTRSAAGKRTTSRTTLTLKAPR